MTQLHDSSEAQQLTIWEPWVSTHKCIPRSAASAAAALTRACPSQQSPQSEGAGQPVLNVGKVARYAAALRVQHPSYCLAQALPQIADSRLPACSSIPAVDNNPLVLVGGVPTARRPCPCWSRHQNRDCGSAQPCHQPACYWHCLSCLMHVECCRICWLQCGCNVHMSF